MPTRTKEGCMRIDGLRRRLRGPQAPRMSDSGHENSRSDRISQHSGRMERIEAKPPASTAERDSRTTQGSRPKKHARLNIPSRDIVAKSRDQSVECVRVARAKS